MKSNANARRREEFERIKEAHGGLVTPEDVFEAAKDPASVFHDDFEWDVQKAFLKHNLEVARNVIREFTIIRQSVPVREHHSVTLVRGGRAYADIPHIRVEPSWREEVSERLWKNMQAAARDLVAIVGIEELDRRIDGLMIELGATRADAENADQERELVY